MEEALKDSILGALEMVCPLGPQIIEQIKTVLAEIPEIQDTEVNIVWNPPWNKDMMSRYAKIALGVG
ncbi:probable FeS assembly SUF system protein SufT [Mycobacteroides abscessus subsp. abscessus]|nr:probable FeS assembly SUF system protein SufT [Mycobacteroides abscessus subsp. abscessus]